MDKDILKRKKIAMLFPYAPAYREPIYQLMDKEFDVDWYFAGNARRPLKLFDYSLLKRCNLTLKESYIIGPITKYDGISDLDLSKYDIVIMAGVLRNISEWLILWKYRKSLTRPLIYLWTHGWYGKENPFVKFLKKIFYKMASGGLFLYGNYARELMLKEGFKPEKLYTIYNSLDYDKQLEIRKRITRSSLYKEHFRNENPNIIFIGRLTKVKKLEMLLNAVHLCKNKYGVSVNVTFIGDGEKKEDLKILTKNLGMQNNVWFYGASYNEEDNAQMIYNADVCVAPGNIGLTAMHCLVYGTPVITHSNFKRQMPEFEAIIDGATGVFFEYGNVESLASSLIKWLNCNSDREKVRKACFFEVDNYWNPHHQIEILSKVIG